HNCLQSPLPRQRQRLIRLLCAAVQQHPHYVRLLGRNCLYRHRDSAPGGGVHVRARVQQQLGPRDFPGNCPSSGKLRNATVPTLKTSVGWIDLLGEAAGVGSFEDVKASAKLVDAFERRVWTPDLRGLIAAKRAAGRPKDLQALPELESLLETPKIR